MRHQATGAATSRIQKSTTPMTNFHIALLALALARASTLPAQSASPTILASITVDSADDFWERSDRPIGCLASITTASMYRETVFLESHMPAHTDGSLTVQADLMADDVAAELRALLGAHGADVPLADSVMSWYAVPSQLIVIAHADGSVTRRMRSAVGDSSAAVMLLRAFDAARARGAALMLWPENLTADSLIVRLTLVPSLARNGWKIIAPQNRRVKFAAFYLSEPTESPALPKADQGQPDYPFFNRQSRITGRLILQFVVDTNGRADSTTIRDLWTPGVPRLTGELGRYYNDFVRTTSTWVKHIRFDPARLGLCPVRQIVQFPFEFVTKRPPAAYQATPPH
jgi:hypothetical protein